MYRRIVFLLVALCVLSVVQGGARHETSSAALWVGETHGVLKLNASNGDLEIQINPTGPVRAVAVDPISGRVWVATPGSLAAYDFSGQVQFHAALEKSSDRAILSLDPRDGGVWLARGSKLLRFAFDGTLMTRQSVARPIVALIHAAKSQTRWLAFSDRVVLHGYRGKALKTLTSPTQEAIRGLAFDAERHGLWVLGTQSVTFYDLDSGTPMWSVPAANAEHIRLSKGAAWIAGGGRLARLRADGTEILAFNYRQPGKLVDFVVHPVDGSLWVATRHHLSHYTSDGTLLKDLSLPGNGRLWSLDIFTKALPGALTLKSTQTLGNTVILGLEEVKLEKGVLLSSGDIVVNNLGGKLEAKKNFHALTGTALKADSIKLEKDVTVHHIQYNTLDADASVQITGTETQGLALPVFNALPAFFSQPPGGEDIQVPSGGALTLDPGAYAELKVDKQGSVILSGGDYSFEKIELKDGATLQVAAPSRVSVAYDVKLDKNTLAGPTDDSLEPEDIVFYVGDLLEAKQGALVALNAYVPTGEIKFDKGVAAHGAFIASKVEVKKDATIEFASAFANQAPTANDDALTVNQGESTNVLDSGAASVLANDADPNGDPLIASLLTGPAHGDLTLNADGTFTYTHDGSLTSSDGFTYQACDDGNPPLCDAAAVAIVVVDNIAPVITVASPADGAVVNTDAVTVSGNLSEPVALTINGASVALDADLHFTAEVALQPGVNLIELSAVDAAGNAGAASLSITRSTLPPDPEDVAPPLPVTGTPPLGERIEFLYTGLNPIQTGVAPGTIKARRVSVLRGRVFDRAGNPLPGVKISILRHPELGTTRTQADGDFDMAVNGGGYLTIQYGKAGYLPVQRTLDTQWNGWYHADDVVMIPLSDKMTVIDLTDDSQAFQVAQGNVVTDAAGSRQATLLFPADLTAEITLPDGTTQPLTQLDVRATEYTVGESGPEAMPGELPPASAYTYAVELSVDQLLDQGIKVNGKGVVFNKPVPFYVDNFLDFPTGEPVPTGYYDADRATWIPYPNGRIVEILSEEAGTAVLDVTGNGVPATQTELDELGITGAELAKLAELYEPGDSLWRVALSHLSSWDCNWPYGPPPDAEGPDVPEPEIEGKDEPDNSDEEDDCEGCTISPQLQSVGEMIPISDTPYSLYYQSNRTPGYSHVAIIPLTDGDLPASLVTVELEITIAGKQFSQTFPPEPNLSYTFIWDGRDTFGRKVIGTGKARIRLSYIYPCRYLESGDFGFGYTSDSFDPIGTRSRCQGFEFSRTSVVALESPYAPELTAGNWALSIEHRWNHGRKQLLRGDGKRRRVGATIKTVAGTGERGSTGDGGPAIEAKFIFPTDVMVAPDGSYYISDDGHHPVRRVSSDGIISSVDGTGAYIGAPAEIEISPDGSLFIADVYRHVIWRVTPDGTISTVAGLADQFGFSGDGGPATEARLRAPFGLAVGDDGSIYIGDSNNSRVRRVAPDGTITTIAGTGESRFSGDGGPAIYANLAYPTDVEIGPDGSLYIADSGHERVRRITPDGIISTFAGTGECCLAFQVGGIPATEADLVAVHKIAFGPDGSLYIAGPGLIYRVAPDGVLTIAAGGDPFEFSGDGGPPLEAGFDRLGSVAVAPNGDVLIAGPYARRIRRIRGLLTFTSSGKAMVSSPNGERAFVFDKSGLHLRTIHARTGANLYEFSRDSKGRLIAVTDGDGNTTTIERDVSGKATAIVAPDGQRAELTIDANGHLIGLTDPTGGKWSMAYTDDGLMIAITDPEDNTNTFAYNEIGRLIQDDDPVSGGWELSRTDVEDGYQVNMLSGEGRLYSFVTQRPAFGPRVYTNTAPDGTVTTRTHTDTGETTIERPDGTTVFTSEDPGPRFSIASPVIGERRISLPSGLTFEQLTDRQVSLANPADPLSLISLTNTVTTNDRTGTSVFDASARQWTYTSPAGRVVTRTVDDQSQPSSVSVTGLEPLNVSYDGRGRPLQISQGSGSEQRNIGFSYHDTGDQAGYLATITDPLGRVTNFEHDAMGRITQQTLADGRTISFDYDLNGNLIALTPPGRSAHVFEYDGLDQRSNYTPPDLSGMETITRWHYNLDRQLTRIERPGDENIDFGYDPGGRLASRTMPVGITTYNYEATTGQLSTVQAPGGIGLGLTWDGFLPTGTSWTGPVAGSVSRSYNNNFWLTEVAVNGQPIDFSYDADGLLTQAGTMSLSRHPDHGLITGTGQGAVTGTRTYNGFGELVDRGVDVSGAALYDVTFTRDKLGRIVSETETLNGATHTWNYTYDVTGRLTEVMRDGVLLHSYSYDANGNRLSHTGPAGTFNGAYDTQDRLISYGTATYTHTPAGERATMTTLSGTTTYNYDAVGNLRQVILADGTVIEYLIDGFDRRVGKKVNGVLVQGWLYRDQLNPVAELDGAGNVVSRFVYAGKPNVPAFIIKGGVTYRMISDHLGSVRLVVNAQTGAIAQRMDYSPFGQVIVDTNPGFQPFGFAGGLYDPATGLVRFGARDYDPATGRWTAKDSILFRGGDSNLYGYVVNDPVNGVDPNGEFKIPRGPNDLPPLPPPDYGGSAAQQYEFMVNEDAENKRCSVCRLPLKSVH